MKGELIIRTCLSILNLLKFLGTGSQLIFPIEENLKEEMKIYSKYVETINRDWNFPTIFHSSTDFLGPNVLFNIWVSSFQFSSYFDSPVSWARERKKRRKREATTHFQHIVLKKNKYCEQKEETKKSTTTITIFNTRRGKFSVIH